MNILFLCTGNSCRSQMAEGWAHHLHGDEPHPFYSAGIEKHGLNPNAVKVMAEAGVDISRQQSKDLNDIAAMHFDIVFTLCGHADETCPIWPHSTRKIHRGFDDPPRLAQNARSEETALDHYRRVRDEIQAFVSNIHIYLETQ